MTNLREGVLESLQYIRYIEKSSMKVSFSTLGLASIFSHFVEFSIFSYASNTKNIFFSKNHWWPILTDFEKIPFRG